ncbi:Lipase class 3 family protein [Seminavis robusta]|uniref:Lipase class 3 family protein n=1 Tax=Seminavis robusta TaxID=568900 RepID=A0A9N8DFK3_9STRA|nr:Lipase class 3 family protein [Seminavis robusta]|eukprot:Sro120_g058410.1 Lipase class 3 family protein (210) ;mRNA; r:37625-38377
MASSSICNRLFLLVTLLLLGSCSSLKDKATGIPFVPQLNELSLFGVGVRKKGPIKVYAVGLYCSETLKQKLSTISKAADKGKQALAALREGVKEHPTTFLLEMNFKVGAEKMANAIAESVSPRYTGPATDVDDLKGLIANGVKPMGSVGKGNKIQFDCSTEGIAVAVDGQDQGNVTSSGLAAAFCDVYLDDKSVSPTLRDCCINECCAP